MKNSALKNVKKILFVLLILTINFSLKQIDRVESNIASANIDGGFIIVLLIGLSYGGYKMFLHENAQ